MKDLPTWSDLNKGVRKMTDKEFEYCEEMEKRKHDEKVRELEEQIQKMKCCANCPVWLLNQSEKNCKDCEYKEALILLRR